MAITKIWAIKKTLSKAVQYIENPEKTEHGLLVSGYNCHPESASVEFALTAEIAQAIGKKGKGMKNANLAYHLLQSFSPNDPITPEQAHEMGRQLADRFLKGNFEYVISTHTDKDHIHNHIIINSTSWLTGQKLRTKPFKTAQQLRAISDQLCINHELSVIRQPGKLSTSYTEWMERQKDNSWKAEIRRRLNFVLARATSYEEFLSMCGKLDLNVKEGSTNLYYSLRDSEKWPNAKEIRGKGKHSLADTDHYTKTGVQEQTEENAEVRKFLRSGIMEEIAQSNNWEDFLKRLESNHGIRITQGKLGLIYHTEDGLRRKEAELGTAFQKEQLLRALSDRSYIPGDEAKTSIREEWENSTTGALRKDVEYVPVELKAENIEKISLEGLLLRVPDQGELRAFFIDNNHVDFDPNTKTYTAYLASEYYYYALKEHYNPDVLESEQLGSKELRGEDIIRCIERENQVESHWVDVPTDYIRSMRPEKLILSFPDDGIPKVAFEADDIKISPSGCQVRIYDHWSYGRDLKGGELRELLLRPSGTVVDQMWRRYRAYSRRNNHQRTKLLAKTLRLMERENIQGLDGFSIRREAISGQKAAVENQIRLLQQRQRQYAMAYRNLLTVQKYSAIYEQTSQAKGWAKKKLEKSHQTELALYQSAVANLNAMNVHITVEPEKVKGLMDNLNDEVRRYQQEANAVDKRMEEVTEAEDTVREVLNQEREEQRDDRHRQDRDQSDRKTAR